MKTVLTALTIASIFTSASFAQPAATKFTADPPAGISAGEVSWGKAMQACLTQEQNAKHGCYVAEKDGHLTAYCPKTSKDSDDMRTACSKQANASLKPKQWTATK